jgi:hypothetical protein
LEKALKYNQSSHELRKDLKTITPHTNYQRRRTRSNSMIKIPPKEYKEVVVQTLPEMNHQKVQTSE